MPSVSPQRVEALAYAALTKHGANARLPGAREGVNVDAATLAKIEALA